MKMGVIVSERSSVFVSVPTDCSRSAASSVELLEMLDTCVEGSCLSPDELTFLILFVVI